ncbi:MAG: transporter substrate-binding domain-containing protein [Oscillospiraceae bacterium]
MKVAKAIICRFMVLFGCAVLLCGSLASAFASETTAEISTNPKVIRFGWYDYAGFYQLDENGYRSGYGYDYLQELARYGGWSYEYVNGTVKELTQMLVDGEIDMMGSTMFTPERAEEMEFSDISMGRNFSVLCSQTKDMRFRVDDPSSLDGIHIGMLDGDARQQRLEQYAQECGFTYTGTAYATPLLMEKALKDKAVDAILTTNMRVTGGDEKTIAKFAPMEFYFITQKGNTELMAQINKAMEQIEYSRKDFRAELSQKYFSVDMSGALTFTEEEEAFIKAHPVIHVALPTMSKPMAYLENGTYKGIIVGILNELGSRIGVKMEYLEVETQAEGNKLVSSGQVDVIANTYYDYGWAEMNDLVMSRPYMTLDYVSIARVGTDLTVPDLRVAAVRGYLFSYDFVENKFKPEQIIWYESVDECIDAVQNGQADICFNNSYIGTEHLQRYQYRNLYSTNLNYSHGLSAGVAERSITLLSIIDKGVASMGKSKTNSIILENTMLQSHRASVGELILRNPVPFIAIFGFLSIVIIALTAMLISFRSIHKKDQEIYRAKLAAERDSLTGLYNRLSFEAFVNELLIERKQNNTSAFIMLDIDNFKNINDVNGHSFGDKVLIAVAQGMHNLFDSEGAISGRMGGDEFAVFIPQITSKGSLITKLRAESGELAKSLGANVPISCSLGVAFAYEHHEHEFNYIYELADAALYEAKRNRKGTVCVSSDKKEAAQN